MTTTTKTITVTATVNAPAEKVWELWNNPAHIVNWNSASPDWHTPSSTNDLRVGGAFTARMEAKDGSFGFDFYGVYDAVRPHEYIAYTLGDNRKVSITFTAQGNSTHISESFEAETQNPEEMQQAGWQAILNNFKNYAEANSR